MYRIIIQLAGDKQFVPAKQKLRQWATVALSKTIESAEITIRVVDTAEMTELNTTFRHKQGPTNVLSFPAQLPADIPLSVPMLGDIVICADVVNKEAETQGKTKEAHWAHMVVHGVFHLLGHDHEKDDEAAVMEALEINVLKTLGFGNPYEHDIGEIG